MKTILHLIETSGPGGAEKMLISLVEHLDKTQYKSIIGLLKDGWLNAQLKERGFHTVIIPQRRGLDLGWIYKCIKLIRQKHVDLLHAHEFTMNVYGSIAAWSTGIPAITTVHGKAYYVNNWRRRLAYRFVARTSARMVAVSEDIRRYLMERVGVRSDSLITIYNGIDSKQFASSEDRVRIRKELGISETAPAIGTIGNLYPVKGHTDLLKAAAQVVRMFPESVFLIVGRGDLLSRLQIEAGELGLANNVMFIGFREDIPALLQAMDLFVLPSLSEGLSLSLLEAMAAGKPVVATTVGGNPEVISHGETGFLVPPGHPESLSSRIILLLQDQPLARKFGINGQQRVYEKFGLEQMVHSYRHLYEKALLMRPA